MVILATSSNLRAVAIFSKLPVLGVIADEEVPKMWCVGSVDGFLWLIRSEAKTDPAVGSRKSVLTRTVSGQKVGTETIFISDISRVHEVLRIDKKDT